MFYTTASHFPHSYSSLPPIHGTRRGMTLVELLVVIGIIGVILSMGIPALTHYAQQVRLKAATQQLLGLVSLARSSAISARQEYALVVDPLERQVKVMEVESGEVLEQMVQLPSTVTLEIWVGDASSSETQFIFRPTGSLKGRSFSLILSHRERSFKITVTAATGAVFVE